MAIKNPFAPAEKVEKKLKVLVYGPSGAGKTTLVNLITRFFDPQAGQILIDQVDIKTVQKKSLREQIAIVPQDVHLFGTSIRENIRYGKTCPGPTRRRVDSIRAQGVRRNSEYCAAVQWGTGD